MKKIFISILFLTFTGLSSISVAHHSSAPHFDDSIELNIEGTVTQWRFVNPHSYLYLDVVDENGVSNNWRCEMHARTPMQRSGFTDETFFAGQKISVTGSPARREDNVCALLSFRFSDGTEVARNGILPEKYRIGTVLDQEVVAVDVERAEFLDNGQPNISGYWVRANPGGGPPVVGGDAPAMGGAGMGGGMGGGAMGGRPRGPQYDLTELAVAEQAKYEQIYDNPSIQCDITNIFFGWQHDANVNQITQEDDKITLLYGFMDFTRTIHLNMQEHPSDLTPSRGGHSIGHWQDNTLVVDTIGFAPGVLNPLSGEPYGEEMHSVEKFSYDAEAKTLNRSYVIEDPVYLNSGYSNQDSMIISDLPYQPYSCIELSGENNQRPAD